VLIAKKGTTYLVLTNKHVVGKAAKFQIQTPDGQKHAAQLVPSTQIDPKYDAVLLQFTSRQTYTLAILKYDTGTPLTEGREIYSAGFPFDSERLRFTTGAVTQLSDVPLEDGTQIGYITNPGQKGIRQGMSGGPVLDGNGAVIGINTIGAAPILPSYTYFDGSKPLPTKATEYAKANWGVPIYNVLTQLNPDILYNYENLPKIQRQVTPQGYMAELNRKARQQTVRIEFQDIKNGSGVIVAKEGNTYYVLTAKHVVWDSNNKTFHSNIKTITDDQQSYAVRSSDITLAEGSDIAIVKFTSTTNYPVATLGNYYTPYQYYAWVFIGGYPERGRIDSPLWQWQLNPGAILDKERGKLATQDKESFSNGYDLIYTSISYRGMSGGPVFDTEGRVIGIHGRAEGESEELILGYSLGISIQRFLGLTQQLQVPNSLAVSSKLPARLSPGDRDTVIAIKDNIIQPQADSSGEQWLQYGNQLYRIAKDKEAAVAFDRAIAKDRKYQLLGNYGKARVLLSTNKELALSAIERAIAAVPAKERGRYYYFWTYQSLILGRLGKYEDALKSIEIAIRLEPNDLMLLNQKAEILSSNNQKEAALAIYDLMIAKKPESYAYFNRGVLKDDLGPKQEAIADYDKAIFLDPNDDRAYYNRGIVKYKLDRKRAAMADFDKAISLNPNLAQAYLNRGSVKSDLGQKQEAIADYDKAISLNPNVPLAYYNRGLTKAQLEQKQAAIADYDQAISLDPNYAKAYLDRGVVKALLGQKQTAISDLTKAAELFRQQGQMNLYEQAIYFIQKIKV
jgi:tetratricopeptide (TPR) repeat protein